MRLVCVLYASVSVHCPMCYCILLVLFLCLVSCMFARLVFRYLCAFVDVCLFLLCIPFHVFVNICLSLFIMYAHVAYVCLYLLVCVPNYVAYICDFFRCVSGRVPVLRGWTGSASKKCPHPIIPLPPTYPKTWSHATPNPGCARLKCQTRALAVVSLHFWLWP